MVTTYNAPDQAEEQLFWQFINLRQQAFYNRKILGLSQPWSGDKIINHARFTNVYRELDRGTQFVIEEILENEEHDEYWKVIAHAFTYRFFGKIETYQHIADFITKAATGHNGSLQAIQVMLDAIVEAKQTIFTGAYISGMPAMKTPLDVLIELYKTLPDLEAHMLHPNATLQTFCSALRNVSGFGAFKAYQCAIDLAYPLLRLSGSSFTSRLDINEWTQAGPGCVKGLAILGIKGNDAVMVRAMRSLREKHVNTLHPLGFKWIRTNTGMAIPLSLGNIENCLCEFQKYRRMQDGGHTKTVYRPLVGDVWRAKSITIPAWGAWYEPWEGGVCKQS